MCFGPLWPFQPMLFQSRLRGKIQARRLEVEPGNARVELHYRRIVTRYYVVGPISKPLQRFIPLQHGSDVVNDGERVPLPQIVVEVTGV